MDSHDVFTKGWLARMQPPLVPQPDAEKLWYQFVNGDIDILETDHAPHSLEKKIEAEEENPHDHDEDGTIVCYGVPGSEFVIPQLLNQERLGRIPLERIVEATSTKPAEIIGISLGTQTQVTWSKDLYQIDKSRVVSGAETTPYEGNWAVGEVVEMRLNGKHAIAEGDITELQLKNRVLMRGQSI
jgi:dihydroorotase